MKSRIKQNDKKSKKVSHKIDSSITQCDLSFIRNMGGYSSNEFKEYFISLTRLGKNL